MNNNTSLKIDWHLHNLLLKIIFILYAYTYYSDEKCQTIKNAKEVPKCASYIQCEISKLKPIYLIFSSFPHLLKVISQVHYEP